MELMVDFDVKLVRTVTDPAERRRRLLIAYGCLLKSTSVVAPAPGLKLDDPEPAGKQPVPIPTPALVA